MLLENDRNREIKGIIPVNFAGRVVDMEAFRNLADEFGCWIIEDACHSPGGYFINEAGQKIKSGSGHYADLAIFSFHPVKHIAAGEGGMITTNDEKLFKRILNLRTHGIQQDYSKRIYDNSVWYYEMQELGYNYRLTDIQATLARSQLKRAQEGLEKRKRLAILYNKFLNNKSYIKGHSGIIEGHAYHLYVTEVEKRDELIQYLRNENIFTQAHYIPVHLMPYYRERGWKEGDLPLAESYYSRCMSLPMFPTLSDDDFKFVIEKIETFYTNQ